MKTLSRSVRPHPRGYRFTAPLLAAALTLALPLLAPTGARAAYSEDYYYWSASGTGNWADPGNWLATSDINNSSPDPAGNKPANSEDHPAYVYIDNGGTAVISSGTETADWLTVGFDDDTGMGAAVSGSDSALVVNGDGVLNVGSEFRVGPGSSLLLTDNGAINSGLSSNETVRIGMGYYGRQATATLSGSAQWTHVGSFSLSAGDLFMDGNALLKVNDGVGSNGYLSITDYDAQGASWTMQGTSRVEVSSRLDVSAFTNAHLTLRENASMTVGTVYLSGGYGGTATLTLADSANLTTGEDFAFAGFRGGTGRLALSEEAVLTVGGRLQAVASATNFPEIAFTLADGATAHIAVEGAGATLTGATLSLDLGGVTVDDIFTLILLESDSATLIGQFGEVLVGGVDVSQTWTDNGDGSFTFESGGYEMTLDYQGGSGNDLTLAVAQVPEPGTWAMMVGGLGVLTLIMRRRRAGVGVGA